MASCARAGTEREEGHLSCCLCCLCWRTPEALAGTLRVRCHSHLPAGHELGRRRRFFVLPIGQSANRRSAISDP